MIMKFLSFLRSVHWHQILSFFLFSIHRIAAFQISSFFSHNKDLGINMFNEFYSTYSLFYQVKSMQCWQCQFLLNLGKLIHEDICDCAVFQYKYKYTFFSFSICRIAMKQKKRQRLGTETYRHLHKKKIHFGILNTICL